LTFILFLQLQTSFIESIQKGELDEEFHKYKCAGTPTMIVFKQKLQHGQSDLESQLKKKKSRQETEESRMKEKIIENLSQFLDLVFSFILIQLTST
jgi:hypothetical protein